MRKSFALLVAIFSVSLLSSITWSGIRNKDEGGTGLTYRKPASEEAAPAATATAAPEAEAVEAEKAAEAIQMPGEGTGAAAPVKQESAHAKPAKNASDRADSFVAGPDWEFDGFVSGAQSQEVRSMFYINDLIYLNIGSAQGLAQGDRVGIYKRGSKIHDPQTGKFIGYEVRRAGVAKVTDKINDDTCAVRVVRTYEDIEIGDLVRRGE